MTTIPRNAHFIWLGRELHWIFTLAVKSAALRGGFETVTLHHDAPLEDLRHVDALSADRRIRIRRIDPRAYIRQIQPFGDELAQLYDRIGTPSGRSNILRTAVLFQEGGVYLDTDTLTIATFEPLLQADFFCGTERIALPDSVAQSRNPAVWMVAGARIAVRDLFRRHPEGWRLFKKVERMYPLAVNNAVLGAKPAHPLIYKLLEKMIEMPPKRQLRKYALGPRLLERELAHYAGNNLVIHPPEVFYPLSPEISQHWFRFRKEPNVKLVVAPSTVVIHWYASVRTKGFLPIIDSNYVKRNVDNQFYSALAAPFA